MKTTATEVGVPSHDAHEWRVWQEIHTSIAEGDRAPQCVAWAFVPGTTLEEGGGLKLARDKDSSWLSLQFIPRGHWRSGDYRDFWLLTERLTSLRYNYPAIDGRNVTRSWDFSVPPEGQQGLPLQLFKAGNALAWAALSTGLCCRSAWRSHRRALLHYVEAQPTTTVGEKFAEWKASWELSRGYPSDRDKLEHLLILGGSHTQSARVLGTWHWLPRPCLAFQAKLRETLFDLCTTQATVDGGGMRIMPYPIINALCAELASGNGRLAVTAPFAGEVLAITESEWKREKTFLIRCRGKDGLPRALRTTRRMDIAVQPGDELVIGQQLGSDLILDRMPRNFAVSPSPAQARLLRAAIGHIATDLVAEDFFRRQIYELERGLVHVPAHLAGCAAGRSRPSELLWLLRPAQPSWDENSESYILPTLREFPMGHYRWQTQSPSVELTVDLTPPHEDYLEVPCGWFTIPWEQRRRRNKPADVDD